MNQPGLFGWADVAIGAAVRIGENAVDRYATLRARSERWAADGRGLRLRLAERGTMERSRAADAASRLLARVVDAQLELVLRRLESQPERVRALVGVPPDTIVSRVRTGDEAVDRLIQRRAG
jgi:hypothetical protein